MDKETLLHVVQSLLNKTTENGCTEEEASVACAKAHELLHKYQLDMFEVEKMQLGEQILRSDSKSDYEQIPPYLRVFAARIAESFNCKHITCQGHRGKKGSIAFVGTESDCRIASYFYVSLSNQLYKMGMKNAVIQAPGDKANYTRNFIIGAGNGIRDRLVKQEETEISDKNTAMILVRNKAVEEKVHQEFPTLVTKSLSYNGNDKAQQDGYKAGQTISLNRGVGNNKDQARLT